MAVAAVLLAHEDALHQPLRVSRSRCGQTVAVARSLPALARSPKEIVSDSIKFGGVTLDCPNAGKLAEFYAEITGGQVAIPGDDWAMMTTPDGRDICFQAAPAYEAPSWPDPASSMQMHLDFDVDDLDSTEARVLAAGATKYELQPNDHCRVYADPVGHPFCLSTAQALQEQA